MRRRAEPGFRRRFVEGRRASSTTAQAGRIGRSRACGPRFTLRPPRNSTTSSSYIGKRSAEDCYARDAAFHAGARSHLVPRMGRAGLTRTSPPAPASRLRPTELPRAVLLKSLSIGVRFAARRSIGGTDAAYTTEAVTVARSPMRTGAIRGAPPRRRRPSSTTVEVVGQGFGAHQFRNPIVGTLCPRRAGRRRWRQARPVDCPAGAAHRALAWRP